MSETTHRRIIRRPQVEERTGLSKATLYEHIADGRFPRPVPLGAKSVGWLEHEVDAWLDARIAERDLPPDERPTYPRKRKRTSEAHATA